MNKIEEIVNLAKTFISIPSDVNHPDAAVQILKVAQKELKGFSSVPFIKDGIASALYTNTTLPAKNCKVILNAHLDVIPGEKEQFTPFIKDGRLYGRGAYDMKAAAAALLLVFRDIGKELPYTLGLQLTTDEEIIGYKGVNYQLTAGVTTEFALSGECSSNMRIVNQLRGLYVIRLHANGTAAHAAYPWLGENALLKLYEAVDRIHKRYPTPKEPTWVTTVNLAHIETSNLTHNKVPHEASALLDVRFIEEDTETVLPEIEAFLPEGVSMERIKVMPAHHTQNANPFVQKLSEALEKTGITPAVSPSYAGSDIIFYSMNGMDSIEFGPQGAGHHSAEEWVDIQSLGEYYEVIKQFLLSIA